MVTKRRSKTKRRTTKRKTTKRKTTRRKTTRRKTTKRKTTKRKTTKRKTIRRKAKPTSSKKGLESKIAQLEAQLTKLSTTTQAPPPPPKVETPPPPPKVEVPKPAETAKVSPPVSVQEALESDWQNIPMGNWNQQKAKVTGYAPESNRAWARRHAQIGTAPSSGDWNIQKAKVTGYAPASNQYFATRQRLSYNPPGKTFGAAGFTIDGATAQTQSAPPPPMIGPTQYIQ